jgi:type IV pilus assembly protein PilE
LIDRKRPDNHLMLNTQLPRYRTALGFTLIELLITMVIVGLLAFIAVPSLMDSVRKGRRAEAFAALGQLQQAQERFRANNSTYANILSGLPGGPPPLTANGYYAIALVSGTAASYTATATAQNQSTQSKDLKCLTLRVAMATGAINYTSTNSTGVLDSTNSNRCWPQ